jgi:hypothetical protein
MSTEKELLAEIEQLQRALHFWLPSVPPTDGPIADRIEKDAWLLSGYDGEPEADAQTLGWIWLETLCQHGLPLAQNICGPCSQGRPTRRAVTSSEQQP